MRKSAEERSLDSKSEIGITWLWGVKQKIQAVCEQNDWNRNWREGFTGWPWCNDQKLQLKSKLLIQNHLLKECNKGRCDLEMHKDDKSHKSNKFVAPLEYVKSLHVETQTGRPQQILQHLRCFFLNALLRFPICCSLGEVVEANVTEHVKAATSQPTTASCTGVRFAFWICVCPSFLL